MNIPSGQTPVQTSITNSPASEIKGDGATELNFAENNKQPQEQFDLTEDLYNIDLKPDFRYLLSTPLPMMLIAFISFKEQVNNTTSELENNVPSSTTNEVDTKAMIPEQPKSQTEAAEPTAVTSPVQQPTIQEAVSQPPQQGSVKSTPPKPESMAIETETIAATDSVAATNPVAVDQTDLKAPSSVAEISPSNMAIETPNQNKEDKATRSAEQSPKEDAKALSETQSNPTRDRSPDSQQAAAQNYLRPQSFKPPPPGARQGGMPGYPGGHPYYPPQPGYGHPYQPYGHPAGPYGQSMYGPPQGMHHGPHPGMYGGYPPGGPGYGMPRYPGPYSGPYGGAPHPGAGPGGYYPGMPGYSGPGNMKPGDGEKEIDKDKEGEKDKEKDKDKSKANSKGES